MPAIDVKLIIFVRAPRPGEVKTRLADVIGAEAACAAYHQLVTTLLHNLEGLENVELRVTPDTAGDEIAPWLKRTWQWRPQGDGNLGARLRRAFDESFAEGPIRTVVIGSDCPDVSHRDVEGAWAALDSNDVVLGPARDGGYWLIGLKQQQAGLFEGILWSSARVLEQTLERIESARLRVTLLRELRDIDTAEDWFRWRNAAV